MGGNGEVAEYERLKVVALGRVRAKPGLGATDADEIAHEAVVGYFLAVGRGVRITCVEAFVVGAVRRQRKMHRRWRKRRQAAPLEVAEGVVAPARPVDSADIARVMKAMPLQEAIWLANFLRDRTDPELAHEFGVSVGAIHKRRQRVRERGLQVF